MATSVGKIINEGGLRTAIDSILRGGGGARGESAARKRLEKEFPDATKSQINNVLGKAKDALGKGAAGRRSRRKGEFDESHYEDVSPSQRSAGVRGKAKYYIRYRIIITYRDRNGDEHTIGHHVIVESDKPHVRSEADAEAMSQAEAFWKALQASRSKYDRLLGIDIRLESMFKEV